MKATLTLFAFLSLFCFSSCEDFEFPDFTWPSGPYGSYGFNFELTPADIERINLDPGYLSTDSIDDSTEGKLTVYGHFNPYINRKISVSELGIILSDNWWDLSIVKKYVIFQNQEWEFQKDTTITFSFSIEDAPINQELFARYYIRVKNNLPGDHIHEYYEYHSAERFDVSDFMVAAVNDSVVFLSNTKAVLWSHLESKKDCELITVRFLWSTDNFQNVDTVATAQYLIKNIPMVISDTISILPRILYQWTTSAYVKFEDESKAYSSTMVWYFTKE